MKPPASHTGAAWRARFPMFVGFLAVAALLGGVGVWSVRTTLAGAVIAPGMVQLESNRQVIQHPEGGVVGDILIRNGDRVEAGDIVVRFDDTLFRSELAIVEGQLSELAARKLRLQAERDGLTSLAVPQELAELANKDAGFSQQIDGQTSLFEARLLTLQSEEDQLIEQRNQFKSEIQGIEAEIASLIEQRALVLEEMEGQESLFERGLTSMSQVTALRRDKVRLTGEIGGLRARSSQVRGSIVGVNIQVLKLSTERREQAITELRDLELREIELAERKFTLIERLARLNVRSPVGGVAYGSQVFALQSVIQPGAPIMYVIPQDQPLVISARVNPIDVDQVYLGQNAALRFSGFEQRTTPELEGKVTDLSADSIVDAATGETYFSVELLPQDGEVSRLGDKVLLPGMPVEVFIKTDARTPLDFLTSPLLDYFNRAMRG